jgi:cytochrome P450
MKECELGGFDLPFDTNIFVLTVQILRDPKYWNNPNDYHPQRFWDKNYKEKELPEGITREMVEI